MKGRPDVEKIMAPMFGGELGSKIYNPIYESVAKLIDAGSPHTAARLVGAILQLMAKCRESTD